MVTQFEKRMIDGYVLSPCHIFWVKRSGERTKVAQKGDFINHELIAKLQSSKQKLEIEELICPEFIDEVITSFSVHRSEVQVRAKIEWRNHLLYSFKTRLLSGDNNQFELDQVMWKIFSKFSIEQSKSFLEKDIDLFKRSMSIASSYTLMAFILGYYHDEFLGFIFNQVFTDLFDVTTNESLLSLKENLEKMREKDYLSEEEKNLLSRYYSKKQHLFNERLDGTGPMEIHQYEMSDLEVLLIALNRHFSFMQNVKCNILCQIKGGKFQCDQKILNLVLKTLEKQKGLEFQGDLGDEEIEDMSA